jgi:GTP-binding protein LepA
MQNPTTNIITGFEDVKPMVLLESTSRYRRLRRVEKLNGKLVERCFAGVLPESSAALGFGFRCGFLGMLHMELSKKEREFNMTVITTVPNVSYHALQKDPTTVLIVK